MLLRLFLQGLALTAMAVASITANALELKWGATGGLNMTEYDADGASFDSEVGIELGALGFAPIRDQWSFRTGALLAQKKSSTDSAAGTIDYELDYLEVPATAMYSFNERAAAFAGLNFDILLVDKQDAPAALNLGRDVDGAKGIAYNLVVGGHFALAGPHGLEASYEMGLSDVADDIKIGNSLGLRYVYMFQ